MCECLSLSLSLRVYATYSSSLLLLLLTLKRTPALALKKKKKKKDQSYLRKFPRDPQVFLQDTIGHQKFLRNCMDASREKSSCRSSINVQKYIWKISNFNKGHKILRVKVFKPLDSRGPGEGADSPVAVTFAWFCSHFLQNNGGWGYCWTGRQVWWSYLRHGGFWKSHFLLGALGK